MLSLLDLTVVVGSTVALGLGAPGPWASPAHRPPDSVDVARAAAVATSLGADLMGQLLGAPGQGGPAAAIAYCADSAQARTARHQQAGVYVRRVGTRLRNRANAPDSLEALLLAAYAAALASGRNPGDTAFTRRTRDGGEELQFFRPIVVARPCLTCHGPRAELPAPVSQLLAERYPDDEATGYTVGDLRGGISVRLASAPPRSSPGETH